jgi:hypothetical protein
MSGTQMFGMMFVILGVLPRAFALDVKVRPERRYYAPTLVSNVNAGSLRCQIIRDPASGIGWRVATDPRHPEWPSRLVEISGGDSCGDRLADPLRAGMKLGMANTVQSPTVRAGDWLRVSQDTRVVHAEFNAMALSTGWPGDSIKVRLRFGGKVMRVKLTTPGQALLIEDGSELNR